mgnify:FL=1
MDLREYPLSEIGNLKIHGRTTGNLSPLTLFWTGSGIELNVKASELWIEFESAYDIYEPWIAVTVNGVVVSRQMVTEGRHWICIFRGMGKDSVKNIRIIKETQALNEDPNSYLQIHKVKCDGEFLPVEDRPYKIEFIGDSITSGEGAVGAKQEMEWIMMWFSAVRNYTYMVAKELNADYRVFSQSGWGVYTSWDNNPYRNIPAYYEKICSTIKGETIKALGGYEDNDFNAWQSDVIVVNLGTNDEAAFRNPMWRDDVTGEEHKQRMNDDGTFNEEDLKKFEDAATNFLKKLRKYNPKAHIVWAYGMLGSTMMPSIKRAVEAYKNQTGDDNVSVLLLPDTTEETVGARMHPGILSHKRTAKVLADYIRNILENRQNSL